MRHHRCYRFRPHLPLLRSHFRAWHRGSEAKYLPDLLSGKKIGAFGLTEPGAGTDAQGQQTTAVLDESGENYILNGSKCFITNGNVLIPSSSSPSPVRPPTSVAVHEGDFRLRGGKDRPRLHAG